MKLTDLEPSFVGNYREHEGPRGDGVSHFRLPSVEGAQGVLFTCPKCGGHEVLCWFANPRNAPKVPDAAFPRPGRWTFSGETLDVLTLSPSVDLSGIDKDNPASPSRCYWHGFVQNGEAR